MVLIRGFRCPQFGLARLVSVTLAAFHQPFQFPGIGLIHQFPAGRTAQGNDRIPVGHRRNPAGVDPDGLADLGGKILQLPHGRVLPEHHAAIFFSINFKRIAFPTKVIRTRNADFLRFFLRNRRFLYYTASRKICPVLFSD